MHTSQRSCVDWRRVPVSGLFSSIFGSFFTWWGVFVLAALDSSVFLFAPMGPDALVVYLSARDAHLFWLYALMTTAGSALGAAFTYWMGRKVGEAELARFVRPRQLERVKQRVKGTGAFAMALPAALPPPFPLTAFMLTCGALELPWARLFTLFAGTRVIRFGLEALLARRYGSAVLRLVESRTVQIALGVIVVGVVVGSIIAILPMWRRARQER